MMSLFKATTPSLTLLPTSLPLCAPCSLEMTDSVDCGAILPAGEGILGSSVSQMHDLWWLYQPLEASVEASSKHWRLIFCSLNPSKAASSFTPANT